MSAKDIKPDAYDAEPSDPSPQELQETGAEADIDEQVKQYGDGRPHRETFLAKVEQ